MKYKALVFFLFLARDGTRAFVTGQFNEEGLIEDVSDFSPSQLYELYDWKEFYHKSYTYVGKWETSTHKICTVDFICIIIIMWHATPILCLRSVF